LPAKHITQSQENLYMKNRQTDHTQETAAAKAGISVRSGRRIEKGEISTYRERHWRTRKDPLDAVWKSVLVPLLKENLH
jgi:DNA-binding XRE family transcriptional regulator